MSDKNNMRIADKENRLFYIARLLRTISYLRPSQFYYRIRNKSLFLFSKQLAQIAARLSAGGKLETIAILSSLSQIKTNNSYLGQRNFQFLNQEYSVNSGWVAKAASHLWQFNLHYFDFLCSPTGNLQGLELIRDWILNVPVGDKIAWHPYPTSRRICNWIWYLSSESHSSYDIDDILSSLKQQTKFLLYFLEKDLLGNHLLANITALIVAGTFFNEQTIIDSALKLLRQQLAEQILPDGGHYERSPMYHSLVLEDLIAIHAALKTKNQIPEFLSSAIKTSSQFYVGILDNKALPLLNDSSSEIAIPPVEFLPYLIQHQFITQDYIDSLPAFRVYKNFGLVAYRTKQLSLTFDTGDIGPDFLPGHAHNDILSILINTNETELLTDSGTYHYQGELRNYFRSARAHNIVMLKDIEPNEIWNAFRVGRRGHISKLDTDIHRKYAYAEHSCYSHLNIKIAREVEITENTISWSEIIDTDRLQEFESNLHFAPGIICKLSGCDFSLFKNEKHIATLKVPENTEHQVLSSPYSVEFGEKTDRLNLRFQFKVSGNAKFLFNLVNHQR